MNFSKNLLVALTGATILAAAAGCGATKAATTSSGTAPPPPVTTTADEASTAANAASDTAADVAKTSESVTEAAADGAAMAADVGAAGDAASPAENLTELGKAGIGALASKLGLDESLVQVGLDTATSMLTELASTSPEDKKTAAKAGVEATAEKAKETGTELAADQLTGLLEGLQGLL